MSAGAPSLGPTLRPMSVCLHLILVNGVAQHRQFKLRNLPAEMFSSSLTVRNHYQKRSVRSTGL
ncbi:MAG: hypothetical protein ACRD4I_00420, partial [Candidatus Angelobacter sp.]